MKRFILVYILWCVAVMCFGYCANIAPRGYDGGFSALEVASFMLGMANFGGGFFILVIEYLYIRHICQKCGKWFRATYASDRCICSE